MTTTGRSTEREQFLADIICTAIEGGTGYWAVVHAYKWQDRPPRDVFATIVPTEVHEETPQPGTTEAYKAWLSEHGRVINPDLIARGIGRIKQPGFGLNSSIRSAVLLGDADNDAGMIDADGADVIVQAGLFGEVVYG